MMDCTGKRLLIFLIVFSGFNIFTVNRLITQLFKTPDPTPQPRTRVVQSDWKEVPGSSHRWFAYSAHTWETPSGQPCVAVVTLIAAELKDEAVLCHLWSSKDSYVTFEGRVLTVGSVRPFTAALVYCVVEEQKALQSLGVTVTHSEENELNINDALFINDFSKNLITSQLNENISFSKTTQPIQTATIDLMFNTTVKRRDLYKLGFDRFQNRNESESLALCVRPIFDAYNDAARIIEFIELHKILGVQFFFFYNYSIGPDVDKVLRYYVRKGDAVVVPWSLPLHVYRGVHMVGQLSSQADCHMRASGFSLVAMWDLDEFIIPRETTDLVEMVKGMEYHASYRFRNVFFYNFWEDDTTFVTTNLTSEILKLRSSVHDEFESVSNLQSENKQCLQYDNCTLDYMDQTEENKEYSLGEEFCSQEISALLLTLRKTKRVSLPSNQYSRSKYIMRPQHVAAPTVHFVDKFFDHVPTDRQTYFVPEHEALCHHYRSCEKRRIKPCITVESLRDTTAHRYTRELLSAVVKVFENFCGTMGTPVESKTT